MKAIYNAISYFLDTSLLGIFIGIISSVAVNIGTAVPFSETLQRALVWLSLSVLFLIGLNIIRRKIEEAYSIRIGELGPTFSNWRTSADFDRARPRAVIYFIFLIGFVITSVLGIAAIREDRRLPGKNASDQTITAVKERDSLAKK